MCFIVISIPLALILPKIKKIPTARPIKKVAINNINKSKKVNKKVGPPIHMVSKYNPIIASLYISDKDQLPIGIVNVDSENHSGALNLTLLLLGFSLEKEENYIVNISVYTTNQIIHYENMVLDLSIDNIPSENMIDSETFGTNIAIQTANINLPENEYVTVRLDLTLDSQILSTKESTAFVK